MGRRRSLGGSRCPRPFRQNSDRCAPGVAAYASWSRTPDRTARTAPARTAGPGSLNYWVAKLDPDIFADATDRQKLDAADAFEASPLRPHGVPQRPGSQEGGEAAGRAMSAHVGRPPDEPGAGKNGGVEAQRSSCTLASLTRLLAAFPGVEIVELWPDDLGGHALAYALAGWGVFPLRGKVPTINKEDGGNGVLDATTNLDQIATWWTEMPGGQHRRTRPGRLRRPRRRPPPRRARFADAARAAARPAARYPHRLVRTWRRWTPLLLPSSRRPGVGTQAR